MYDYPNWVAEDSSLSNRNGRDTNGMGGGLDNGDGTEDIELECPRRFPGVRSLRAAGPDSDDRILTDSQMEAVQGVRLVVRLRSFHAKLNSVTPLDLGFVFPLLVLARSHLRTARLKTRSARLCVQMTGSYYKSNS